MRHIYFINKSYEGINELSPPFYWILIASVGFRTLLNTFRIPMKCSTGPLTASACLAIPVFPDRITSHCC